LPISYSEHALLSKEENLEPAKAKGQDRRGKEFYQKKALFEN
jgi:hypothetical protein